MSLEEGSEEYGTASPVFLNTYPWQAQNYLEQELKFPSKYRTRGGEGEGSVGGLMDEELLPVALVEEL